MLAGRKHLLPSLLLCTVGLACATPRPAPSVETLGRSDLKFTAVVVVPFTVLPSGTKEADPTRPLAKAQETCVALLVKSGLFDSVIEGDPVDTSDATLVVHAQLTGLRFVTAGKHQWLGGLAGKSEMKMRVSLTDLQSGAVVATTEVVQDEGTAGGPWTFGATDRSLPAEVGARIAEFTAVGARR